MLYNYKLFILNEEKKVKLLKPQIKILLKLPETGIGYQKVKLTLKNGKIFKDMTVLNSEILLIKDNQDINIENIEKIEIDNK
jgi:hypothetical protein